PHDAPGQITPDGYRTFTTNNDGYAYGEQVLGHPGRNPHAFPRLSPEQQQALRRYTSTARPLNLLLRTTNPTEHTHTLHQIRQQTGPGWPLYELTPHHRPPTLADLGDT
ncbi:hypothetical protein, partial [Nocardiopsis sp. LOL_012]|uniref:hypothetical protein n=1 Tax=Nocardiopsis sp. LOL_012 TaxID=3345409 RepID=UPI003A88709A